MIVLPRLRQVASYIVFSQANRRNPAHEIARCKYAFLLAPLPPRLSWILSLVSALSEAERDLSRLATLAGAFPFPRLLNRIVYFERHRQEYYDYLLVVSGRGESNMEMYINNK